jgi:hypothetical protein
VDIYNTLNGSWSTATLSQPRSRLAATSVGNLVLFGGGYNGSSHSNVVDVFNVTSNTWTTATLSKARSGLVATSVDNRYDTYYIVHFPDTYHRPRFSISRLLMIHH